MTSRSNIVIAKQLLAIASQLVEAVKLPADFYEKVDSLPDVSESFKDKMLDILGRSQSGMLVKFLHSKSEADVMEILHNLALQVTPDMSTSDVFSTFTQVVRQYVRDNPQHEQEFLKLQRENKGHQREIMRSKDPEGYKADMAKQQRDHYARNTLRVGKSIPGLKM